MVYTKNGSYLPQKIGTIMLKFDNAFLTKSGNVGMQFKNKEGKVLSIYKDHKGDVQVSEDIDWKEGAFLVAQYFRRQGWYKK